MIRYRFALNENDELIDINNLIRDSSTDPVKKFFTLDAHQELIPKLGNIRQKHFSLKSSSVNPGSKETYLHALGKKVFYDIYRYSLDNKTPYYIKYKRKNRCDRLEEKYGKVCYQTDDYLIDLCKFLTEINVEKVDDQFVPDLLISNTITKKKIYIEIAVTHTSSRKKIESGYPIIEFIINSEEDIQIIREFGKEKSCKNDLVKLYNFRSINTEHNCSFPNCKEDFYFFSVGSSGKSRLTICKENQIYSQSGIIYSIAKPKLALNTDGKQEAAMFKSYVKKAFRHKAPIKNCFLCRYHAENDHNSGGNPIFCKYLKLSCNSNEASKCSAYRVDLKYTS